MVASQCIFAFSQAACVFGAPANAGALKATISPKARMETSAFMGSSPPMQEHSKDKAASEIERCYRLSLPEWFVAAVGKPRLGFCNRSASLRA